MKIIYSSATKLVLMALTLTACVAFIMKLMPVDQFMILSIAVYSYYFAKPVTPETTTTTSTTVSGSSEK